ncbi:uncharacterized protein N7483_008184 [Penicillium malachiteum]|uniref:uncharacterized protein n=1 Tax=Penicillium malachiteum TaxID=1324776 RepID=UPI002549BBC0|nr:uncharacterized protein N7483_008184 [Penicillium malachiteum]KAJ5720250.1 hypothetical protein N7483_008184 [Penicillium malachiteum]
MAIPSHNQGIVPDATQTGSPYAPSETDSLFSTPMDQEVEQWMVTDASPPSAQSEVDAFQPLTSTQARIDHEGPDGLPHTTETFQLYAALWDSYNKRTTELRRLEEENYMLRSVNIQLCHQLQTFDRRNVDQGAMLAYSEQGFKNFRNGIRAVLEAWENSLSKIGS